MHFPRRSINNSQCWFCERFFALTVFQGFPLGTYGGGSVLTKRFLPKLAQKLEFLKFKSLDFADFVFELIVNVVVNWFLLC